MKIIIFAIIAIFIFMPIVVYQQEFSMNQLMLRDAKFVAEEAAAGAAQYIVRTEYAEGRYIFNQTEGKKAAEYIIKQNLNLNDDFTPKTGSYWTEKITYTIEFIDDTTLIPAGGAQLYTNAPYGFTQTMTAPTVVVTLNCGRARYSAPYSLTTTPSRVIAEHEWKDYE